MENYPNELTDRHSLARANQLHVHSPLAGAGGGGGGGGGALLAPALREKALAWAVAHGDGKPAAHVGVPREEERMAEEWKEGGQVACRPQEPRCRLRLIVRATARGKEAL